jgi:predicted metalloprotease with PDZ domain
MTIMSHSMNSGNREAAVGYRVSMEEPWTHSFMVRMTVRDLSKTSGNKLAVAMPVWTPGSYLVRDFARNVLHLDAVDERSNPLQVTRETKSRWLIDAGDAGSVTVNYRVHAFDLETNTSYIDTEHAIINGASVFLYAEGLQDKPINLRLIPYKPWSVVSTGLEQDGGDPWVRTSPDYDVLVDSPIEVGNQSVSSFKLGGIPYDISIFASKQFDQTRLVDDLEKIVEGTLPIYEDVPYERYVFLIDFVSDGFGGLEHLNSTHCIGSYYDLEQPEEYRSFLTLFSHEFFHTWNVKRMRPQALGPFDYSRENYTHSLWIAEGVTSYYENIILRRAGITPLAEFLDETAEPISHIKSLPSSRVQTPEESSFETWVRYYRQDENSPNVSPSYYKQGAVLGLLLDLQIRTSSELKQSLDDVMRRIYRETYSKGRGYTDEEFESACSDASNGKTADIFTRYVHAAQEIDYDRYLGYAGLQLVPKSKSETVEGFLGIRLNSYPRLTVRNRLTGTPAEAADISAGDEIIATDGLRTDDERLKFYIATKQPGTSIELTIARGGVLKTIPVKLATRMPFEYRIAKKDDATQTEKELFTAWSLAKWDEPLVYKEHRSSPTRRRFFDYF